MLTLFKLKASRTFTAGNNTIEKALSLTPVTGAPHKFHPVLRLAVGDLKAGDVLDVGSCTAQVSSKALYNMMIGSVLILTGPPCVGVHTSLGGWGPYHEVTEAQAMNINKAIHHYPVQRTALWTVPVDIQNAHLNFIMYCASDAWNGTDLVTVDQDYGRLEVAVHREVTPTALRAFLGLDEPVEPPAPAPAPEPPPPPPPGPELIAVQITQAQATALQEVAAAIAQG